MGLNSLATSYAANQVLNAVNVAVDTVNFVLDPRIEYLADIAVHAGQALLRRDGYFGVKIDSLNIDVKLLDTPEERLIMDVANLARMTKLGISGTKSPLPTAIKVISSLQYAVNFWANKFVAFTPKATSKV